MSMKNTKNKKNPFRDFLDKLKREEQKREPFDIFLTSLKNNFYNYLKTKYDKKKAKNYRETVGMFVMFLTMKTEIEKLEDVTEKMIVEDFFEWHNKNTLDDIPKNELKDKMKEFFVFLENEKRIVNKNVLDSLQ
jgi:site-specific recombinase XerD